MIHPSYTELIEAINAGNGEEGDTQLVLNSRYSLVLATSKRARQLIAGSQPLVKVGEDKKPLSIAIDELYKGKVKILPPKEVEEKKEGIISTSDSADFYGQLASESEDSDDVEIYVGDEDGDVGDDEDAEGDDYYSRHRDMDSEEDE